MPVELPPRTPGEPPPSEPTPSDLVAAPDSDRVAWPELVVHGLPFAVVAALAAFMVERDGGFAVTVWYPVGLAVLATGVTLLSSAWRCFGGLPPLVRWAVAAFAGLVAWLFLTISWAAVRGDAWDGANRALLYLLVFALLAAWRTSVRALWPLLMALAFVVAVEGMITVEQVARAGDPTRFLIGSRLSEPLGYPNATAALFMIMFWLMVGLGSRTWLAAPVRGVCFGLASINLTLNLLTQSRGSVYTFPLVAAVYLLLVPGRLRSLAAVAVLAVGFAATASPILHVYDDPVKLGQAYQRALEVGGAWAVILIGAGWMFALGDQRLHLSNAVLRRIRVGVAAAAAIGALALLVTVQPWSHVRPAWQSFKTTTEPSGALSRFGGLGSNRYDLWRVGLIEFRRHPIQGIGADNFLVPYLQQRRSGEEPAYPHSLIVDLLSQSGLVGTLLFAAFLAAAVAAARRVPAGPRRDLARILVVGASVWLLHAQVDWLWEVPVLGVIGMGLLGAALGLVPRRASASPRPVAVRRRRAIALAAGVAVGTVVVGGSFLAPWLAQRDVQAAGATWRTDPGAAFARLDRAHDLNPLSDQADLVAGVIASRLHRYAQARDRFERALRRSPDDWYAALELGIAASLAGPPDLAESSLRRAVVLDPREPIIRRVLRDFLAGRRIDPDAVDRAFANAS